MNVVSAIFFGIIQGLTEFLPVSSSGHLAIMQNIFGMENVEETSLTFTVLLHLGTLIAVFLVYRRDIFSLIPAFFTGLGKLFHGKRKLADYNERERMVFLVILATVPLVLAVLMKDGVALLSAHTKVIGFILMLNALVLYISDRFSGGNGGINEMTPRSAVMVGLCQFCAVLPGLSRSGATITGGLLQGFSREFAVKFSFILSIPAILGANILEVPKIVSNPIPQGEMVAYIAGVVAAALSGIAAMKLLQFISRKSNFRIFSYYCLAVGLIAVIFG